MLSASRDLTAEHRSIAHRKEAAISQSRWGIMGAGAQNYAPRRADHSWARRHSGGGVHTHPALLSFSFLEWAPHIKCVLPPPTPPNDPHRSWLFSTGLCPLLLRRRKKQNQWRLCLWLLKCDLKTFFFQLFDCHARVHEQGLIIH